MTFDFLKPKRGGRLLVLAAFLLAAAGCRSRDDPAAKYVILFIADGWGYKQIEAANSYTGSSPPYMSWIYRPMATWDLDTRAAGGGTGYDPSKAWSDFSYPSSAATDSGWDNTLVIVTGDHECGFLTPAPGVFPDQALGTVSAATIALEKTVISSGRRASWVDTDLDDEIDVGETVYWAWNSGGHSNSLIPLYANGVGAVRFAVESAGTDPVRGSYIDNTTVFRAMFEVMPD